MSPVQLDQLLLVLIGLILAANVAVVAVASRRIRGRWQFADPVRRWVGGSSPARRDHDRPESSAAALPRTSAGRQDDAQTAAAIEAFVAGVDGAVVRDVDGRRRASATVAPEPDRAARSTPVDEAGASPEPASEEAASVLWDRLLHDEGARVARFGRPVTVAYVECPDLEVLAERLGQVAADRIAAETARLLHAHMRETDRLVRLGRARFGVLLVETDELEGHLFAERVRAAANDWLAAAGLSARLAIGLAGPGEGRDLELAAATARERMNAAGPPSPAGAAVKPRREAAHRQAGNHDLGAHRRPATGRRQLTERA